ncbi:MAG: hypothetical protein LAT84_12045 [Balneolia bacterium]|nr:hypothetical protein [Balneolia bacterium]
MTKSTILTALLTLIMMGISFQTASAQSLNEVLKQHMNETVQQVKATDDADEKRSILNASYENMLETASLIEKRVTLNEDEAAQIALLKSEINDRANQLNGLDGYERISDEDLDEFSDYSQQAMEQANRTLTISLTTALLIVIILLLL